MARPKIPPELVSLVIEVATELRRIEASGFLQKVSVLDDRYEELPRIMQGPFGFCGLSWELEKADGFLHAVELLGLLDAAPPPQESVKGRKRSRRAKDEAWLRRQLDGLGDTGGA